MYLKRYVYDKLFAKTNNINTSGFALKTKYDTDKAEIENKITDVTDGLKRTNLTDVENKIQMLLI